MTKGKLALVVLLVATLLLVVKPAQVAHAAPFAVNSTADAVDASPGDGVCDDGAGNCTLRAAIMEANALPGADSIHLPALFGTTTVYALTIAGTGEDAAATGDLDITSDLTITGDGQAITIIDGGSLDRVFHIFGEAPVKIARVTIRGGNAAGGTGGGVATGKGAVAGGTVEIISSTVSGNTADSGGGIYVLGGSLSLMDSTVSDNTATGGAGGGVRNAGGAVVTLTNTTVSGNTASGGAESNGGGIHNADGTLTITASTISANTALWGGGIYSNGASDRVEKSTIANNFAGSGGGGVFAGELTMTNTTVSGNSTSGMGGGIYGAVVLTNSTVAENTATDEGGGLYRPGGLVELVNTIVANNTAPTGPDCSGAPTSLGQNLIRDPSSCGFTAVTGDLLGVDPLLGPLQNNGGTTDTSCWQSSLPGPARCIAAAGPSL